MYIRNLVANNFLKYKIWRHTSTLFMKATKITNVNRVANHFLKLEVWSTTFVKFTKITIAWKLPQTQETENCYIVHQPNTYLVSTRIWRSNDNCRKRKNVRIDLLARSTSPHGNLFVKSIPVNGVTVGGKSKDASDITNSTLGGPI